MIDVTRARADTPGTRHVIHLNNAGAALQPLPVLEAVRAHLDLEARIGGYEAEDRNADLIDRCYDLTARLVGADRDEIALVESATTAWMLAFNALAVRPGGFRPGDRILMSQAEYAANLIPALQAAARFGLSVEIVPDDETGATSVTTLEAMLDERVRLIAITHVPTNGGLVNPVAEIGRVARQHNIPYLLDACQSVGQMPVDVAGIGCDFLSATGRKFLRGPRGTGFLYVARRWLDHLEPATLDLHGAAMVGVTGYRPRPDARRFEIWESNVAARIGFGVAVEYALGWGLAAIEVRLQGLAGQLRDGLRAMPGVTLRDRGARPCAIVTFTIDPHKVGGRDAGAIKAALRDQGINISVSSLGSTPHDMTARGLSEVLRVSPHYYNDEEDIAHLLAVLANPGHP